MLEGNKSLRFSGLKVTPTTPDDPVRGVLDSLAQAADHFGVPLGTMLGRGSLFRAALGC